MLFWTKFVQNGYFKSKTEKWMKFKLKMTIFSFWTKFAQKQYFRSKTEKVNIHIEFCIFELSLVSNDLEFWNQIFPKRVYPIKNRKNWTFMCVHGCYLLCYLLLLLILERTGPTVFLMYLLLVAQTTRSLRYQYSTISVLHVIIWLSYNIPLLLLLLLLPLNNSTTTEQCQYSVMFSLLPRDNYTTT